jgi:hypothetical protein
MIRIAALLFATATAGGAALLPLPAAAQDQAGDRVNTVIIYGDDECPTSEGNEITVCARLDESERFRIPERLRQSQDPANEAWASRVQAYEAVGNFGPLSCSTVGSGSELGCTPQLIEAAYAERRAGSGVRFSQLIEQERAERLATIDAEAAATQARVEEQERLYEARQRAAQEGTTPTAIDPNGPPAAVADPSLRPPATPGDDVPFQDDDDAGAQAVDSSAIPN